jgi:hypothetical protein
MFLAPYALAKAVAPAPKMLMPKILMPMILMPKILEPGKSLQRAQNQRET